MGIISDLVDLLTGDGKPKNWQERLREEILLISPEGNTFIANWRGNPITIANSVSVHEFPDIQGARVQDLRPGAFMFPLTLFFTGKDNDLDATKFMNTVRDEGGVWQIQHPVKGPLFLTLLTAEEQVQPVTGGGTTTIETLWIEGLPESEAESAARLQAQAEFQSSIANETSAAQFALTVLQDTAAQAQAIVSAVGQGITKVKQFLRVVENTSFLTSEINAIESAINNTLAESPIDTPRLAGQVQQLVQRFGFGQSSASDAVDMYEDFADSVLEIKPVQPTLEGISTIAVGELYASAAIVASGQSSLIGGITSRQQTVTTAIKLGDIFDNVTNGLDETQTLYGDEFIDRAYFSQTESYGTSLVMNSLALQFLLFSLFGLPAERIIILREDKAIQQIAHDEYGNIGNEFSDTGNIDLLIESNDLIGNDMWLLEAGRQVLIYQSV